MQRQVGIPEPPAFKGPLRGPQVCRGPSGIDAQMLELPPIGGISTDGRCQVAKRWSSAKRYRPGCFNSALCGNEVELVRPTRGGEAEVPSMRTVARLTVLSVFLTCKTKEGLKLTLVIC